MAVKLDAWHQSPHDYVEGRDKPFGVSLKPRSRYVAMPDGCRLAVDVYLPQLPGGDDAPEAVWAIVVVVTAIPGAASHASSITLTN